jgi:hypothetical protein
MPPGASNVTSSASRSANPSMSWALKVAFRPWNRRAGGVPFLNASRVVVVMRFLLLVDDALSSSQARRERGIHRTALVRMR